jgi:phage gpG-like protein
MAKRTKFHAKKVREAVDEAVKKSGGPLHKAAVAVQNEAKISMKSGGGSARTPSQPGTPPHTQSGAGRASIQQAETPEGTRVIGPTEIYMKIHEFGGIIRPRIAKALAIPLTERARKSGGPREFDNLTLLSPTGKNPVLMDPAGEVHFVLVRSVRIPKRPVMRPALQRAKRKFPAFFKGIPIANTKAGRWLNRQ